MEIGTNYRADFIDRNHGSDIEGSKRRGEYRALIRRLEELEDRTDYARAVSCVRFQEPGIVGGKWIDIVSMKVGKGMLVEEFQFSSIVFNTYKRVTRPKYPSRDRFGNGIEEERKYHKACHRATILAAVKDVQNPQLFIEHYQLNGTILEVSKEYRTWTERLRYARVEDGYLKRIGNHGIGGI